MMIILKKITYSAPDVLHLHWGFLPTFDVGLTLLSLLFVGTLCLALEAIVMSRDVVQHRIWVITHVLLGMTVHYQRVLMYTVFTVANALHPFNILPPNGPKAWAMELNSFAATGYGGFALSAWWIEGERGLSLNLTSPMFSIPTHPAILHSRTNAHRLGRPQPCCG